MNKNKRKNGGYIKNCAKKLLILSILVTLVATLSVPFALSAKSKDSVLNYSLFSQKKAEFNKIEPSLSSVRDIKPRLKIKKQFNQPNMVVRSVLTAYTSTPDQTDDSPFIAANGTYVYDGMVAANWLPFGTKIKIPSIYGDKIFTVEDRMNQRYGFGRMDIWLDATKSEAIQFGVKIAEVEIYYPNYQVAVNK